MPSITYIKRDGERVTVNTPVGVSVKDTALANRIAGIIGECGGNMICSTCHVYVDPDWAERIEPISATEDDLLLDAAAPRRETSRLSCQIAMSDALDGLVVEIPERQT